MIEEILKKQSLGSFINNQFIANIKQKPLVIKSSVTKKVWKKLYPATSQQIDQAIQHSQKAFTSFRKTNPYERSEILNQVALLLRINKDALARVITTEMGKTIKDAAEEVEYAIGYFEWFSHETKRILGYEVSAKSLDKTLHVRFEPIGPCAIITPWNFPIAMAARKIAPAIGAGCTVIAKPSPETCVTSLILAYFFKQAHLPSSVLQVLIGDEKFIGKKIMQANEIRKISFTGSTKVGKQLYASCALTLKKATLELGGNAPFIVFKDANLNLAVEECIKAKFRNQGQSCIAANRIFVQNTIAEKFIHKFVQATKSLNVGNPFLKSSDLTNILHAESIKKMKRHIADGLKKGAKLILKGENMAHPHIMISCAQNMQIFQEETFGPLAAIFTFDKDEEAVTMANGTSFGLAAYFCTTNLKKAQDISKMLYFGMIGLNDGLFSTHQIPFGGVKHSGFGREGGPYGIYEYLVEKAISMKIL